LCYRARTIVTHSSSAVAAAAATEPQVVPLYAGKKAVVVGAGPAGSTAAMFLARQGFSVDVFERRPEPKADAVDTGRAYIIILIPRGQAALKEVNSSSTQTGGGSPESLQVLLDAVALLVSSAQVYGKGMQMFPIPCSECCCHSHSLSTFVCLPGYHHVLNSCGGIP
jgi:threonine dehydrogenase-like Zn-dependent dehydrogenase